MRVVAVERGEAHARELDAPLDAALQQLPQRDLEPLATRLLLTTAKRRLGEARRPASRLERYEPPLLIVLSAAHLVWALLQVLAPAN